MANGIRSAYWTLSLSSLAINFKLQVCCWRNRATTIVEIFASIVDPIPTAINA